MWIAVFFALTVCFFAPLVIYLKNSTEYPFYLEDLGVYVLRWSGLVFVLTFVGASVSRRIGGVIFAFAFAFLVQGNVLTWKYGVMNGQAIPWDSLRRYGFIDTSVWAAIILSSLVFFRKLYPVLPKLAKFLLLYQAVLTGLYLNRLPPTPSFKKFSLSDAKIFDLSKNRNVVILMLDGFQSDIFAEILEEKPSLREDFKNFTYYPDAMAAYVGTYLNVPLFMTGQYYDNSVPVQSFVESAYRSSPSVFRRLRERGFETHLKSTIPLPFFYDPSLISNTVPGKHVRDFGQTVGMMAYHVMFKHLPHFLKRRTQQFWQRDTRDTFGVALKRVFPIREPVEDAPREKEVVELKARVTKEMEAFPGGEHLTDLRDTILFERAAQAVLPEDVFSFYMYVVPHPECVMNESLRYEKSETTRACYKKQAKGALVLARRFLTKLKQLGIYDKSAIFVMADHGFGFKVGDPAQRAMFPENSFEYSKGFAAPLVLFKPFGEKGAFKTSNASISLKDIPATIFAELGIEVSDVPGMDIRKVPENSVRPRPFFAGIQDHWNEQEYWAEIREYSIEGNAWDSKNWRETGKVYKPKNQLLPNKDWPEYQWR